MPLAHRAAPNLAPCCDVASFELFIHPSEHKGRVVDLLARSGPHTVDVPAQVAEVNGDLLITLFTPQDGPAWTYSLNEFREALDRAAQALREHG